LTNETHNNSLPGGVEYRLPFQNVAYRATVRVVDFFPPKLEDFAVSYNPEYKILSDVETDSQDDDDDDDSVMNGTASQHRRRSWEWRFCLLVEDARPAPPGQPRDRMKLFVWGHEAEHLLRLDAVE
jgi:protection-of-telomeres protein 1